MNICPGKVNRTAELNVFKLFVCFKWKKQNLIESWGPKSRKMQVTVAKGVWKRSQFYI